MKAKVKNTGEIVEVYMQNEYHQADVTFREYTEFNKTGRVWLDSELDFLYDSNVVNQSFSKIEKLNSIADGDIYGNIYGTRPPNNSQFMDKINELIDRLENIENRLNKLETIKYY